MTETIDLLDDAMVQAARRSLPSERDYGVVEAHDCHGCGEFKPDVDLWAEDYETGEQLWLCEACADW